MNPRPKSHMPPLYQAAAAGDLTGIARLLALGEDVNQALDATSLGADVYWVATGVASGEDYAFYEISGPLAVAIACGQTAAAFALLDGGASPQAVDPGVMPPLVVAVREGNAEMVRELLARGASVRDGYETSVLYEAAARGDADIVGFLLDAGAAVDEKGNEEGETALAAAARQGHRAVVELLVAHGASRGAPSEEGTPAEVARAHGHEELARLLGDADAGGSVG